jgi:hypothetical protein
VNGNAIIPICSKFQLSTERNYVRELAEMLCHYMQPLEALELSGSPLLPPALRGQTDTLFGNLRDLVSGAAR